MISIWIVFDFALLDYLLNFAGDKDITVFQLFLVIQTLLSLLSRIDET